MRNIFGLILVLLVSVNVLAQERWSLSGVLISKDDGLPIIGATIIEKGTTRGTVTDFDGNFTFEVTPNSMIDISMIGYKNISKKVTSNNQSWRLLMESDNVMLDEVVAIGYGSMKKSDLTGAVASVDAKDLQKSLSSGLDQALQGKVAGVTVNSNSGQPGQPAEVRIRGIGTVNNSAPIYVVDGMILDDISFLSPNDIATTEILKDASSTAIYGSRGANGVILITTKKGVKGKSVVNVSSYVGIQNRWKDIDLMGSQEFAETLMRINPKASSISLYQNQGFNAWMKQNIGVSPYYPMLMTESNPYGMDYGSINTDWQDEVFKKNALIQDHYISVTGGSDKTSYVMSASYFNQDGTIMGSSYERLTLRVNTSHKINDWVKIGQNLSFINSKGRNAMHNSASPGASILSAAIAMAPWDPTHYPEGSINNKGADLSGQIAAASNFKNVVNPFSMEKHSHPESITERWVGDIFIELTPIKNFKLRSSLSMDLANNRDRSFGEAYQYSDYDKRTKNFLSSNMQHYRTLLQENIATYDLDYGNSSWNFMLGQTSEEWNNYGMGGAGAAILNPISSNWYLNKTTEDKTYSSDNVGRARMFSALSRIHYSYKDRYMLTANFRIDGSSKFPENVYGYFPSMAFAWRISEESWMKRFHNLDYLKLRAGWGQIGNDKIAANSFSTTVFESDNVFVGYPIGNNQALANGAAVLTYANKGGKWETTEQYSAGVDFALWNGLLNGTVDGFLRDTKEMLLSVTAPSHVGNRFQPLANVGTVRNQGIELSIGHQNRVGDFSYYLSGNVSFIENKLIALNGGAPVYGDRTLSNEGLGLYTLWGYQYEGVYRSDEEAAEHLWYYGANEIGVKAGDAKYKDLSGPQGKPDGKIDDFDKTDIGNPFPWLTYGLNFDAEYKGIDLKLFFQGVYGNEIYNAVRHRTEGSGNEATLSTSMRDVWVDYSDGIKSSLENAGIDWTSLINPDGTIPNPVGNPMNKETSSRFVESGSYLRLKTLQLGYTLPKELTKKAFINMARIYVNAGNLFTITNYSGYDPEVGGGVDYGNYPQARTFSFGVNLEF